MPQQDKLPAGRPPHEASFEEATLVLGLAMEGLPQEEICSIVGISAKILRRDYGPELDFAKKKCDAMVRASLYQNAVKHNNVTAQIFYAKTQMGWREKDDPFDPMPDEIIDAEYKDISDRQFGRVLAHAIMVGMKGAYNKAAGEKSDVREIESSGPGE